MNVMLGLDKPVNILYGIEKDNDLCKTKLM